MKTEKNDLNGQMNLFDIFSKDSEKATEEEKLAKESKKEETEVEQKDFYPIHRKADQMRVVMHKVFEHMLEKEKIVIAYIDYNVIYYKEKKDKPQLLQFAGAKLAVDYYMETVERLRNDKMLIEDEGELVLMDV